MLALLIVEQPKRSIIGSVSHQPAAPRPLGWRHRRVRVSVTEKTPRPAAVGYRSHGMSQSPA